MALFAYNSTYGYDQVEYLVIGRSLVDGYRLFDFAPSKGPGIYVFVAALNRLGVPLEHLSLSLVIAAVYAAICTATYAVVSQLADGLTALASSILAGLCVFFMSMNFLQPTGFVFLGGLAALWLILRESHARPGHRWFVVGLCLGLAFLFKSVAAFYMVAVSGYAFYGAWKATRAQGAQAIWQSIGQATWLVLCCALGVWSVLGVVFAWFAATGRGSDFVFWTVTFPLVHYSGHTLYLPTLFTKLGWFHLLVLLSAVWALRPSIRHNIYGAPLVQLSLWMGLVSYIAVIKNQAAHYCFPGAGFLCIFAACVIRETIGAGELQTRRLVYGTIGLVVLLVGLLAGVLTHRPAALRRLVSLVDYTEERRLADALQESCPTGRGTLFLVDAQHRYWLSHRYPPVGFVNMNVQTAWILEQTPDVLIRGLDHPQLEVVGYLPGLPGVTESEQFDTSRFQDVLKRFEEHLQRDFEPIEAHPDLWRRK